MCNEIDKRFTQKSRDEDILSDIGYICPRFQLTDHEKKLLFIW